MTKIAAASLPTTAEESLECSLRAEKNINMDEPRSESTPVKISSY